MTDILAPVNGTEFDTSSLYLRLFGEAESVRWTVADIPWDSIERDAVDEGLLEAVRIAALAEFTTYTATQRFMDFFFDDTDFTQWVAVWFYEETKHPQVLMQWLSHFGVRISVPEMLAGRSTHPFMNSRMGTLAVNVISELTASASYLALGELTAEPVLKGISHRLAADEARHASHFFAFAKQTLDRSARRNRDVRAALLVLLLWLTNSSSLNHPTLLSGLDVRETVGPRISRLFEHLTGYPDLSSPDAVRSALAHARRRKG